MRLAAFRGADGAPRVGVVTGAEGAERIVDAVDATGGRLGRGDVMALLQAGPGAVSEVGTAVAGRGGRPVAEVELLAPIARPGKIIALAGNYQSHIAEGGAARVDKSVIVPKLFIKPATSIIGPGVAVPLPSVSHTVDWELELAVVIGRTARNVSVEQALDYVGGYTVVNDLSARSMDWGVAGRNPSEWDSFFDWLNGKWPDGFCPIGPWITTADEVPDPQALQMRLTVNDTVFQDGSTADMIFGCAEMIAFASRFMTLEPGDVFSTGTLGGVGDATGTYLKAGDTMYGWIEGIGTLVTPVDPVPAAG